MTPLLLAAGTLAAAALLGLFIWSAVDHRNRHVRPAAELSDGWTAPVVHLGRVQPAQRGYLAVCTAARCSWARQLDTAAEADRLAFDHTLQLDAEELENTQALKTRWINAHGNGASGAQQYRAIPLERRPCSPRCADCRCPKCAFVRLTGTV